MHLISFTYKINGSSSSSWKLFPIKIGTVIKNNPIVRRLHERFNEISRLLPTWQQPYKCGAKFQGRDCRRTCKPINWHENQVV